MKIPPIIFVLIIIEIAILITAFYFGTQIIELQKSNAVSRFSNQAALSIKNIETQIKSDINVIEVTRNLPIVKNTEYSNHISEEYKGIPDTYDLKKRELANQILKTYPEFEFITFHMPNGDFYIMEPYSDQLNVTRLNFADRDWYKGVMDTKSTYVSDVYNSTTLKRNVVAIRTPVYDDANTLIGIWGGSLKLQFLQDTISNLISQNNLQVIFYDQYKKKILDTSSTQNYDESFFNSYIDHAISGQKNTILENGLIISYSPIRVGSVNWGMIIVQPQQDLFFSAIVTQGLVVSMVVIFSIILAVSGYFAYTMTQKNSRLLIELEQVSLHKDEFSAMISHELKTPLVPIIGYCKMLSKKDMIGNLNKDQLEAVETISRNAKRLEKLIRDILDARKLDINKMTFTNKDFSIREFLIKIESSYKNILSEKGINFEINSTIEETTLNLDEHRLRQVFDNIIENAIKFVPEHNGKISVSARRENYVILFSVTDNGTGIPPEKQSGLFRKFYQVDTSETRNFQGSGLGLSICKGIIESMNGSIWVESDGKNGTTFYIEFPL
ncbi:sensor histidine kinase [Nitrosarchaeum sp.]|uniref:sensor histidine kinase n=1 Tax=Nitrosarchaeum sp. TaxID=2026886 RepID=UPI00247E420D|nr:sensor histidine kinase [Nitrosarchaeum sp.]MCV0413215.1 sensor histidine kinase [Nitrosarchaeum sp.]